jgi:peptidyl-prolyl cis-trans isomerase C
MSDAILANVGGMPITSADVDAFLAGLGQRGQSYNNPQGRAVILEQLIGQKLFLMDATRNLYEAEPAFKAELKRTKEMLLTNYAIEKAIGNVRVTEEEAKKFYDENSEQFMGDETVNASHILVADEETAKNLLEQINSGAITFEDAAKQNSTCPSGQEGGCLGDFGRGQMVPEFDQACFSMEVGELRGPIQTQFGYHLIKLNSKNEAQAVPFAQMKDDIIRKLTQDKQQAAYQSKVNQLKILYPVDKF